MHESMSVILWMGYFLDSQGYPLRPTTVHQDNLSGKQLKTNGRASSSKMARHLNIRYFFVVDVQKRQHITIEYCSTDKMIGNFFTKPVGGAKFQHFRNIIMNVSHDEYGPVDVDELMAIHNEKMTKRFNMVLEGTIADKYEMDEHNISKEQNPAKPISQECVEDCSKLSSMMWTRVRNTHIRSNYNKPIKGGCACQRTYA